MAKKKPGSEAAAAEPQQPETQEQTDQSSVDEGDQGPEGADSTAAGPTAETGETVGQSLLRHLAGSSAEPSPAASPEEASLATEPSQVRQLDRNGHCGHCGNPHVAKYGEGKWKCVCGAGNL